MRAKSLLLFTLLSALPACSFSYSAGGPPATHYAAVNGPGKPARRAPAAARPSHAGKPKAVEPKAAPEEPEIKWAGDIPADKRPEIEWAGDIPADEADDKRPEIEWAGDIPADEADDKKPEIEWAGTIPAKPRPVGRVVPRKVKRARLSTTPAGRRASDRAEATPPARE